MCIRDSAGTIVTLMATGLLTPTDALSGFASTATITVAAMFVLSAGLMRTGALEAVTIYPVSYTHLDVYKRQLHDRACRLCDHPTR